MNRCVRWMSFCLAVTAGASCKGGDPAIGLVLTYQANQETAVDMLYFDELVMMDGRILPMYVSPDTRADAALTTPAGVSWPRTK